MANPTDDRRLELLQGTLDMLILRTLSGGPSTATASARRSGRSPTTCSGSRPARSTPRCTASRSAAGCKAEWGVSEANQRAKYYRLTAAGKAQLLREQDRWSLLVDAIGRVMKPAPAGEE